MKFLLFVGLTILAVASSARVPRDADISEESKKFLDSFKSGLNSLGDAFLKATGANDANDLQKKATEQWVATEDSITKWIQGFQVDAEKFKENPLVVDLNNAMVKLGSDFKTAHPGLTTGVSEEIKKANANIDEVVNKLKALEQSEQSQQIKESTAKLIESAKAQLGSLTKDIQEKVNSI